MEHIDDTSEPGAANRLDDVPSHAEFIKIIGDVARQVREARGWTPEEVSEDLGRSVEHYLAIERGDVDMDLSDADRLSAVLSVSLDKLLDREPLDFAEIEEQERAIREMQEQLRMLAPPTQWAVLMMLEYYVVTSPRRRWPK